MIAAACVEDQELPIAAERPSIYDPTVTGRGDLGGGAACDPEALLDPAETIRRTERPKAYSVHRQRQVALRRGKRHRWGEASWIFQGRKSAPRILGFRRVFACACSASGQSHILFE